MCHILALQMVRQNFNAARDIPQIITSEIARHEFVSSRFLAFWRNGRRKIPRSLDSDMQLPESDSSDSARISVDDDEVI